MTSLIKFPFSNPAGLLLGWLLAGAVPAAVFAAASSAPASGLRPPAPGAAQAEHVLQPLDLIKLEVFQEPDMERQVRLSQDCTVTLPLIQTINLKGKTLQQAQEMIRYLYDRDYLVNPQINLSLMESAKHDVKVLGQVDKAGAVEIPADKPLKLLDAIALAGGFTRLADRKHVTLTRDGSDGKSSTTEINADDILQSKNTSDAWVLREGDVIFVPERIL
ncbi:MAG TPA: polysaccharide biosynthesis/export family protein [Opitutaceae bacterium]|nr:polysaccharide biosynthesis/export family protein [Lacunisphaera sp.]HWA09174.1 polysaccharide biosynthesis/export family protein [Opitutaceae bacterium]